MADAQVVWTSNRLTAAPSLYGMPAGVGVRFLDLSDEDRQLVLDYVQKHTGATQ